MSYSQALQGMSKEQMQEFLNFMEDACDLGGDVPWGELLEWFEKRGIAKTDDEKSKR